MRTAQRATVLTVALRRASTMIEFAFILPIFTFMLLFSLDMGHLVLMSGAMADATFSAARTGAQVGGAGYDVTSGNLVCTGGTCQSGTTYASLMSTVSQIPGYRSLVSGTAMSITSGARCQAGTNDHVSIKTTYTAQLATPGLSALLGMFNGGNSAPSDKNWALSSTAVARCEIIR